MSGKFVLLSTQRNGSTWVIDMLNSHPRVVAYSELLLAGADGTPTWGGRKDMVFWETFRSRRDNAEAENANGLLGEYLDDVYRREPEVDAAGFKLMYGQLGAYPGLLSYFQDHRVKIVHLIRRNVLDVIVSKHAAVKRDMFHARRNQKVPHVAVEIDAGKLIERLEWEQRQVRHQQERFARQSLPYLEVEYEHLVDHRERFEELLGFIDVRRADARLESTLTRMNTASHAELIENYDQVQDVLRGTAYEAMLR